MMTNDELTSDSDPKVGRVRRQINQNQIKMSSDCKMSKPSTSESIIDSLFDSIVKGDLDVGEELLSEVKKRTRSIDDEPPTTFRTDSTDHPSKRFTVSRTDVKATSAPSTSKTESVDQNRPSTKSVSTASKSTKSPSTASKSATSKSNGTTTTTIKGPIKIASLKETTKSKIIESSSDHQQIQRRTEKIGEDGEILPSDHEQATESESTDDEFDAINESDGELPASDNEKKKKKKSSSSSSKKQKKKKKKRDKDKKEKDRSERKRPNDGGEIDRRDDHRRKSHRDDKTLENSSATKRIRHESPDRRRSETRIARSPIREQRPWRKMLNFHLNLDDRREDGQHHRSRSPPRYRRPDDDDRHHRSESYSRTNYDYDRTRPSSSVSRSNAGRSAPYERRFEERRRQPSYSPESSSKFRHRGDSDSRRQAQWNSADRPERTSSKRSRSRSPRRSSVKEPRIRSRSPDKMNSHRKSPPKEAMDEGRDETIDKQKLYEIARKNAAAMLKSGSLQQQLSVLTTDELVQLRSGGKSVEELISYCRKIQKKEKREGDGESSSDEEVTTKTGGEDELDEFIRHPFLVKPLSAGFVFNVKNVTQLPVKTPAERAAELRITFPVSSGEQHRNTEPAWVPVSPPRAEKSDKSKASSSKSKSSSVLAIEGSAPMLALPAPPSPPSFALPPPPPPPPSMEQGPVDVGEAVSARLKAIQRLNDNGNDVEALKMLHFANEQLSRWSESKNIPGLFIGSTGAECLTPEQLAPSDIRFHAWAKKDYLTSAKLVSSGVGMQLMQKMGWRPGEGLGKNREGTLEPLMLEIKSDRKGLLASEEGPSQQRVRATSSSMKDFQGKHPVSALMELCSKRKWGPPSFSCSEAGLSHDRRFTWKVMVNGVEYQTATPSNNKKIGKAQVCQVVLQSLGLVPRDKNLPVVIG